MAKFSKAQYELLTEAFGDALADIKGRDSPAYDEVAMTVARKVAGALKYDNPNFNTKQFIDGIETHSELVILTRKGINL